MRDRHDDGRIDTDDGFTLWYDGAPLHHLGTSSLYLTAEEKHTAATLPRLDAIHSLYTMPVEGPRVTDDDSFVVDLIADALVWAARRQNVDPEDLAEIADRAASTAVAELGDGWA